MAAVTFQVSLSMQGAYPDLGSDMSSALVAQASFRGETTGVVLKCWLFPQASRNNITCDQVVEVTMSRKTSYNY